MVGLKFRSSLMVIIPWLLFLVIDVIKKPQLDLTGVFFLWYNLPGYILWMLLTVPVYRIFKWTSKLNVWRRVLFLIFLGLVIGFIKVLMNWSFFYGSGVLVGKSLPGFSDSFLFNSPFYFAEAAIISWVLLIVFYVIEISRKYQDEKLETSKLETALTEANLQALKMQIQPHFLFNAHNTIATLLRSNKNEEALEMLLKLSDLLRNSLNNFENQFISLEDEIAFSKKYLEIECIRFEDRLKIEFDLSKECQNAEVPVFVLQPLIENAFVHGISRHMGNSRIGIKAYREGERLILKVYNTGTIAGDEPTDGIGLANVRNRLNTLFEDASVDLLENDENVEAVINMPFLKVETIGK